MGEIAGFAPVPSGGPYATGSSRKLTDHSGQLTDSAPTAVESEPTAVPLTIQFFV